MVTMNVSLSLDGELVKKIEALAKKEGKTVEALCAEATKDRVEYTDSLLADVEAGIADAGRVASIDDVEKRLSAKLFDRR